MSRETLRVEGMSCGHCVETIQKAVGEVPGVRKVDVDLEKKEVSVELEEGKSPLKEVTEKIREAGYEVVSA